MPRVPVRLAAGRLQPALAESYPWNCREHVAEGNRFCIERCCGSCYFLDTSAGCQLGSMRPVRCKTYPLIPQKNRVILHAKCPDARAFIDSLRANDARALALLDVAVAMTDVLHEGGDEHSEEIRWLLSYTEDGFKGPVIWKRGVGLTLPAATRENPPARRRR